MKNVASFLENVLVCNKCVDGPWWKGGGRWVRGLILRAVVFGTCGSLQSELILQELNCTNSGMDGSKW